jgi:predicted murein hydrolase (TIGR00659 family)
MGILDTPLFGMLISLAAFQFGLFIYKKTKFPLLNPLLIAVTTIIVFMLIFNIDLETYKKGGDIINFFLGPATVALAVPLYKRIELLKANLMPILVSVFVGSFTAIFSVFLMGRIMGMDDRMIATLFPKSITTAIAIDLAGSMGMDVPITVVAVVWTGICGAVIGPTICSLMNIRSKIATGIAIGTASHAVGTSKAMELGETEGAMSGLAIVLAGIATVILVPLLVKILM